MTRDIGGSCGPTWDADVKTFPQTPSVPPLKKDKILSFNVSFISFYEVDMTFIFHLFSPCYRSLSVCVSLSLSLPLSLLSLSLSLSLSVSLFLSCVSELL